MRFAGRLAHGIRAAMTQPRNMPAAADFADIRDWVFDLDNTLYPHNVDLFSQVDVNMTSYVADLLQTDRASARKLQKQYYLEHGTTLQGLMLHHGVDPDDFLEKAHAIDYTSLTPQPALAAAIKALPAASSSSPTAASSTRRIRPERLASSTISTKYSISSRQTICRSRLPAPMTSLPACTRSTRKTLPCSKTCRAT